MVRVAGRLVWALLLLGSLSPAWAQEAAPGESKGPVLFGHGAGRLWKWDGEKSYLTPEGQNLVLGGVGETQLWGWAVEGNRARFFTLERPKKAAAKAASPAPSVKAESAPEPLPQPVFDAATYPVPDKADRVGDRLLLVYGTADGRPRYELWTGGTPVAARAWDDGRSVYAVSLGPEEGALVAGRDASGAPWLELSGVGVEAPEGWRGRMAVAAWSVTEEAPAVPMAAGWGAPMGSVPRLLLWGPEGWTQPTPDPEAPQNVGVYALLGAPGADGPLELAGWQAEENGTVRPWFWDGQAATVPGGSADGQPQAFGAGKGGAFLIVKHQSAPWFTREDGVESLPLEGLGSDDRVVAVEAETLSPTGP